MAEANEKNASNRGSSNDNFQHRIQYSLIVTWAITVMSWFVSSHLESCNDKKHELSKIKTEYLTNAYRDISIYYVRKSHDCIERYNYLNLERAIRDIQIYGSKEEIKLIQDFIQNQVGSGKYDLDPLLNKLKHNLRASLDYEVTNDTNAWTINYCYCDSIMTIPNCKK